MISLSLSLSLSLSRNQPNGIERIWVGQGGQSHGEDCVQYKAGVRGGGKDQNHKGGEDTFTDLGFKEAKDLVEKVPIFFFEGSRKRGGRIQPIFKPTQQHFRSSQLVQVKDLSHMGFNQDITKHLACTFSDIAQLKTKDNHHYQNWLFSIYQEIYGKFT